MILKELQFGDLIEIKKENGRLYSGIFLSLKANILQIKLENGYNVGLSEKNIKSIKKIKKAIKNKKENSPLVKSDSKKPLIWILHTGGTIASKVDYKTGAVYPLFKPEDLISMYPKLNEIANIKTKLLFNIFSEDMNFEQYNIIAKEIFNLIKKENPKGIIIPHGTDTLHYSSSALSFILENINIPVILVGSQRSSDRGSSDSYENLMNAAYFIINSKYKGVAISMHESSDDENGLILPPQNTRKMHTSRRDAFKPINQKAIARVKLNKIEYLSQFPKINGEFRLKLFNPKLKIAIIKSRPNFPKDELKFFKDYDGIILEGTGLGQFNLSSSKDDFKKLKIPIVMTSQCIYGRINLNVYSKGRELMSYGILGNFSTMTTETAYIKLAWLLSNFKLKDVPKLIMKDIRGEIIQRIEQNAF